MITRIVCWNHKHEIGIASNREVVRHGEQIIQNVLITRHVGKDE